MIPKCILERVNTFFFVAFDSRPKTKSLEAYYIFHALECIVNNSVLHFPMFGGGGKGVNIINATHTKTGNKNQLVDTLLCNVFRFHGPFAQYDHTKNTLLHDKQCRRTRKTEIIFSKQISKSSQGYTASFANQQGVFFTRCHAKGPFHNIMLFNFLVLCFQDIIST